ncbi:hypothetical protein [Effusibacillus pohliae]|uniref:hypothetical protein n=1 Tax=Effusibacillus pohliae TaxID=232270 RepID=UPI000373C209|nr:hypothetical protein [Effusibacillus pohliae]
MDSTHKQIILKEIDSWRHNRLLPAEYCDFLSNLYRAGETLSPDTNRHLASNRREKPVVPWRRLLGSLAAAGLSLLFVLHFTSFPIWMQIGILAICTVACYWLSFFARLSVSFLRTVFLALACLAVAMDGYYAVEKMGLNQSGAWSASVLVAVLVIWMLTGAAGRSRMIVAVAWSGIGLLYGFGIHSIRRIDAAQYGLHSLYWLVFAGISGGLAFFLGRTRLNVAPAWAVTGVLAAFVPDLLYLLSGAVPDFLVDVTAFLKISLLITFCIVFREPIQKWLDRFREPSYNKIE